MRAMLRPTKPDPVPTIIDRTRLYHKLERWQSVRAIAVYAPAGYGKSSLVSRWIDVAQPEATILWLALDGHDADPDHFVRHLAAVVDHHLPGARAQIEAVVEEQLGGSAHAFERLTVLLADAAVDNPFLLVLDDLHLADTPAVNGFLLPLLERGPDDLHLLLLARHRTELNLARLIAHEQVLVLNVEDLRFSAEEIRAYMLNRGFPAPNGDELAQLVTRSEGWITALQLGSLAVTRRGSVPALLQMLQGDRDWLAEFLAEEVLQQQTPAQRSFLLQTSILERFNADLCAAVTGEENAYGRLTAIARADLFLIPLHDEPGWFRYHHLFQELLQHQLHARMDAGGVAALHRKAAAWLAAHEQIPAAVEHLLAADATEDAATLVAGQVRDLLVRAPHRARALVALLPRAVLRQRPRLMLDRCFLAVAVDDRRMGDCLAELAEILAAERAGGRLQPELETEWLVLHAAVAYRQGELDTVRMAVADAADRIDCLPDHLAGILAFLRLHVMRLGGNHAAAAESATAAIAAFDRAGFVLGTIAVRREAARWSMRSGRSDQAAAQFATIFRTWDSERDGAMSELAVARLFAADNHYLCNRPAAVRADLAAARSVAETLQNEDLFRCIDALETLCTIAETGHNPSPAIALDYTDMLSASLRLTVIDMATRRLTMLGRGNEAWQLIQAADLADTGDLVEYQPRKLIPFLRAYLACGQEPAAVSGLIEDTLVYARKIGERQVELQLLAFSAWQQLLLGDECRAGQILAQATSLAQEIGYVRVLLDIPALAAQTPDLAAEPQPRRSAAWAPAQAKRLAVDLTNQEARVLALLAADCTYQEIADEMVISINTVRTHVRHLYRKLDTKRRDQTVMAAQRAGLLSPVTHNVVTT